jgi:hypothetical protein
MATKKKECVIQQSECREFSTGVLFVLRSMCNLWRQEWFKGKLNYSKVNSIGYQVTDWVRSVHEGVRYTNIQITHNILIFGKFRLPLPPGNAGQNTFYCNWSPPTKHQAHLFLFIFDSIRFTAVKSSLNKLPHLTTDGHFHNKLDAVCCKCGRWRRAATWKYTLTADRAVGLCTVLSCDILTQDTLITLTSHNRTVGQLCHTYLRHINYANFKQQDGRSAVPYWPKTHQLR